MTKRRSAADLLGDEPDERIDATPRAPNNNEIGNAEWAKVRQGVTVAWLAGALTMDRKTVQKRLAKCPVKAKGQGGFPIYDLAQAMSYLVKSNFDIADYMRTMNPSELPPMLKKEYWQAENSRALYMQRAGDLWHTDDVLAVFAEAFKRIKDTLQVFPDDLEREAGLKKEQYEYTQQRLDALREELSRVLCDMPKHRQTKNLLAEDDDTRQT